MNAEARAQEVGRVWERVEEAKQAAAYTLGARKIVASPEHPTELTDFLSCLAAGAWARGSPKSERGAPKRPESVGMQNCT